MKVYTKRGDGGEIVSLGSDAGLPLAVVDDYAASEHELEIRPDDRLVLYTDGITESEDPDGEEYGMERLMDFCKAHRDGPPEALAEALTPEGMRRRLKGSRDLLLAPGAGGATERIARDPLRLSELLATHSVRPDPRAGSAPHRCGSGRWPGPPGRRSRSEPRSGSSRRP